MQPAFCKKQNQNNWFVASANFHGIDTLTTADFQCDVTHVELGRGVHGSAPTGSSREAA